MATNVVVVLVLEIVVVRAYQIFKVLKLFHFTADRC